MKKIVEVSFSDNNNKSFLDSNNIELNNGDFIVAQFPDELRFGQVITEPYDVDEEDIGKEFNLVLRKATKNDIKNNEKNISDSQIALKEARKISDSLELNMRIIDAYYNFDRSQLLFHFLSDTRVDFRELAKKLAQIYRTRIELRQIGVRDKAKMVGGIGPCGRFLCCSSFLTDFNSVSINMAKNQLLALNPTKINGICGRLLCCLGYENDTYNEMKKGFPKIGLVADTSMGMGKVVSIDIFKRTYSIDLKEKGLVEISIDEESNGKIG